MDDTGSVLQLEQGAGAALMHNRTAVKTANTANTFMTPNSLYVCVYFHCSITALRISNL